MININNPLLRGTTGQLGKEFVIRKVNGKQVISKFPTTPDPAFQTEAQRATRTRFKKATDYAKECMLLPERKEHYYEMAKRLNLPNAYTAAIKDFMSNAPKDQAVQVDTHHKAHQLAIQRQIFLPYRSPNKSFTPCIGKQIRWQFHFFINLAWLIRNSDVKHLIVLLLALLLFMPDRSAAQEGLGFVSAEVTKKNSEKLNVFVELKENYTDVVNYKTTTTGPVTSILVAEVASIKTDFKTEYENLLIDGTDRILLKMASGKLNMYSYVDYGPTAGIEVYVKKEKVSANKGDATHQSRTVAYLITKQDSTIVLTQSDFKEKLEAFVSDCPKAGGKASKVAFDKIVDVVNLYNKCH